MERNINLYCEVGGIDGAHVMGHRYPADEILKGHWERLDDEHIIAWHPVAHGWELMSVDELDGVFEYAIWEA